MCVQYAVDSASPKELDVVKTKDRQKTQSATVMEEVGTQTTLKRPSKTNSSDCSDLPLTDACVS